MAGAVGMVAGVGVGVMETCCDTFAGGGWGGIRFDGPVGGWICEKRASFCQEAGPVGIGPPRAWAGMVTLAAIPIEPVEEAT